MSPQATIQIEPQAITRRLRAVARRLFAREVARALPAGAIGGSGAVCAALVVLSFVPQAVFGHVLVAAPLVVAVAAPLGALLGAAARLRDVRLPPLREAALALEARAGLNSAALATALEASGDFRGPVLARAESELEAALAAPAPSLYSGAALVLAPLSLVTACFLTTLAWQLPARAPAPAAPGTSVRSTPGGLAALDVPTGRKPAGAEAAAQLASIRTAAEALGNAAEALRRPEAAETALQDALNRARSAVQSLPADARPTLALPAIAPESTEARAELAERMESAAGGLLASARAAEMAQGSGSGRAEGGSSEFVDSRKFVPFPVAAVGAVRGRTAEFAGQSPARRELVRRALEEAGSDN